MFITGLTQTNTNIYAQTARNSSAVSTPADFKSESANKFIEYSQKKLEYSSKMFEDMSKIYDTALYITQNTKSLKEMGCIALQNISAKAENSLKNICKAVTSTLSGYTKEIGAILKDNSLSEKEKESKIEIVLAKKDAVTKEAEAKADALLKISDVLVKLAPVFLTLKDAGVNTDEIAEPLIQMVSSIKPEPTSLDNAKNIKDVKKLSKENATNIFGKNSKDLIKNNAKNIDEKIENANKKLNDKSISNEEKETIKIELVAYKELKSFLSKF